MGGDQDNWVGEEDARMIIRETIQIPKENKDFVVMVTDEHGYPQSLQTISSLWHLQYIFKGIT